MHLMRRDYNFFINHKKIYCLCKENNLLLTKNTKKLKYNRKISKNKKDHSSKSDVGLEHEFIPVQTTNKNAFIEAFFSIFETQFLQVWYFNSMSGVFEKISKFIEFYNNRRLHGSLKYNSTIEFKT
jgi:hypothetical protein